MRLDKRAFTLLELLVSISLIMLLVTFVAVSLRGVRASASRAKSLSALRQMTLAYASYSADHSQRLMPGYIDVSMLDVTVTLPDGSIVDPLDARSYVWRLAPYVDSAWETFFTDVDDAGLLSRFQVDFSNGIYGPAGSGAFVDGGISERPSYGMNSIFVGGDSFHGGPNVRNRHPWSRKGPKIAATRLSEVKNPTMVIVFAPAAKALTNATKQPIDHQPEFGYCELRAPFLDELSGDWNLAQWSVGPRGTVMAEDLQFDNGAGIPIDRRGGGLVPVAHLDGSTTTVKLADLSADMRMWNALGVGPLGLTPGN